MAEQCVLRNEFFEAKLDPASGAIRSIHDYRSRDNRLAYQLAFRRDPSRRIHSDDWDDDPDMLYSVMAADAIEVRSSGPLTAEMASPAAASSTTRASAWPASSRFSALSAAAASWKSIWTFSRSECRTAIRGRPTMPHVLHGVIRAPISTEGWEPQASPGSRPRSKRHIISDVRGETLRTTILTGGLPYHRRLGLRKLDTLLIVAGEAQRKFQFGVGIDLPHAYPAAMELLAPETVLRDAGPAPDNRTGWLFHLSAKNVVATA